MATALLEIILIDNQIIPLQVDGRELHHPMSQANKVNGI